MAEPMLRDVLSRLERQEQELSALRRGARRRSRFGRRLATLLAVGALLALVPMTLLAANPFTDLNSGSVHNPNIDAIYNAGITTGCVPDQQYCPNDLVTRQEMASFLARTAGVGTNPPVTNAKTLQGYVPNSLLRVAQATLPGTTANLTTTPMTIVEVQIATPGPGFVLVNCASAFNGFSGSARVRAFVRNANNNEASPALYAQVGAGADAAQYQSLSPVYLFPVGTPATYTFQCQGYIDPGEPSATLQTVQAGAATITALYTPFDGNGLGGALAVR